MRTKARDFMFVCLGVATIVIALQARPIAVASQTSSSDKLMVGRYVVQQGHWDFGDTDKKTMVPMERLLLVDSATGEVFYYVQDIGSSRDYGDWAPMKHEYSRGH